MKDRGERDVSEINKERGGERERKERRREGEKMSQEHCREYGIVSRDQRYRRYANIGNISAVSVVYAQIVLRALVVMGGGFL